MGSVVYSASLIEALFWDIYWLLALAAVAIGFLLYGILARGEKKRWRILALVAGFLGLLLAPPALSGPTAAFQARPRTTAARVERKHNVDWEDYCTPFAIEATTPQGEVVFFISRPLPQVRLQSCYTFTYRTQESIPHGWSGDYAGRTVACYVTRIEAADETACP